jgi:hypothetical protein
MSPCESWTSQMDHHHHETTTQDHVHITRGVEFVVY